MVFDNDNIGDLYGRLDFNSAIINEHVGHFGGIKFGGLSLASYK